MENLSSPEPKPKRITILADTHDSTKIPDLVERMGALEGDVNVHIGDVFDSEIRAEIIDSFKADSVAAVEKLTTEEKEIFDHYRADGNIPIRAYWLARVQANPELLQNILVELDGAYEIFAESFKELPNAKWLYGNVEVGYDRNPDFKDTKLVAEDPENIEKVELPQAFHEDDTSLGLLFPSLPKNKQEDHTVEVKEFFADQEAKVAANPGIKNVIIIAHEYPFRGLPPEKFKEKMKEVGIEKYFVPFYLPNNYRAEILDFIFKLPEDINVKLIYGHLHDTQEVTQAGIAFKHAEDKVGMQWGVNKIDPNTGERKTRHFDMYQMPFQSIYTVDVTGTDIKIQEQK